ncbi:MAG: Coenzyme F420 hydrogenase/dehydrogenase, beta subunit C-terminal domain [Candidatus Hydrothermarchaeota archaeon]|nr:Coenzyme F420 hydrogenase/dehydrogenase, beta subunit C-terminal domain [Candidatus Hydrothermarchaeota archaeon]
MAGDNMDISKFDILQYRWLGRDDGYTALEHEVIFRDLCSGCGACETVCPDDVIEVDEYPKLVGKCSNCGYCLALCPRSFSSNEEAERKLFGEVDEDLLGHVEVKIATRAVEQEVIEEAQDGGFVTVLLKYLLDNNFVDGAVVSALDKDEPWKPVPMLITSTEELKNTGGTRYSNSSSLRVLKDAKKRGLKELALVGVPCQIEGLRKIQNYPIEDVELPMVKLTIALFCKGNFLYKGLMKELVAGKYKIDLKEMTRIDIKGKNVIVNVGDEEVLIPLKEAHEHLRQGCKVCFDLTSRLSDLSVGSVGSPKGYSTVIARTKSAAEILDKMEAEKVIEAQALKAEKPGVEMIELLQKIKEKDAKKSTRKRIIDALPLPFKNLKF